jgi:predicted nucleic acid-binding Zn ribbon protein
MPTYDYKCVCGFDVEDALVEHADEVVSCPACDRVMARQFPLGATMRMAVEITSSGRKFHGKRERRQELRDRYTKRQAWFEKQPPAVQKRLRRFAAKHNVRMTPPADL